MRSWSSQGSRLVFWLYSICPPAGSLEGLSGGPREAPEEVLRQRPAAGLPHPNVPGHCSQRGQLRDPGPEDPPGLGPGDRRGPVPGGGAQGPHAGEDPAAHLLWRPDVSRGGSGRDGDHRCPRALRHCTETQQQTEERRGEVVWRFTRLLKMSNLYLHRIWKCIISKLWGPFLIIM